MGTYLLTPWCRVLEKLTGLQLVKKFPAFHGTRRFITALTSVRHLSLSWASPIQSISPHPTSWRSILILYTHLRLVLPSGLFPSGFPTKTLYTPLSSPIHATCPAQLILLNFITRTILGEQYKSFSSSLCSLLHSPVTSSLTRKLSSPHCSISCAPFSPPPYLRHRGLVIPTLNLVPTTGMFDRHLVFADTCRIVGTIHLYTYWPLVLFPPLWGNVTGLQGI